MFEYDNDFSLFPKTKEQRYDIPLQSSIYNSTPRYASINSHHSLSSEESSPDSITRFLPHTQHLGTHRLQKDKIYPKRVFMEGRMFDKTGVPRKACNNSEMSYQIPKRFWNTEMFPDTEKGIWNSQMDFEVPIRSLNPIKLCDMNSETPWKTVETEIPYETPNIIWKRELGLENLRKTWDMENSRSNFGNTEIIRDNTFTDFNVQRNVYYGDVNSRFDVPQPNSNIQYPFEMPRASFSNSDEFSVRQPLDSVYTTRTSTPYPSYESFPSTTNSSFGWKTPSPPNSIHRSQSQLSISTNNWNSPQNMLGCSYDQSIDQKSLLNYSLSPTSAFDVPPSYLNVIRPSYMCTFCRRNGETPTVYTSHMVKMKEGKKTIVTCPVLRSLVCSICHQTGDNAHTITYCPELRKRNNGQPLKSTTVTLKNTRVKSNGQRRY